MMLLLRYLKDLFGTPAGASLAADIAAVQADTNDIQAKLGAPVGADLSADIAAVQADTNDIQAKLGAPVGADLSADIAAVQTDVDRVLAQALGTGIQAVAPTLAAPVTVTGAAGAWTLGVVSADIIAAAAVASDFHVDGVFVEAIVGGATYELVLYYGAADIELARVRFVGVGYIPIRAAGVVPSGSRVRAKVASLAGGAQACDVAIAYHKQS